MMSQMVPVPGGQVWAADSGGDGPPVVLLHSGLGDSRMWDGMVPELTPDHRVLCFDVRGYGRSPASTTNFTTMADLVAVLDHFGLDRATLAGCSLGGRTAIDLAVTDPGRVTALVLMATALSGFPWDRDEPDFVEFESAMAQADREAVQELCLRIWAAAGPDDPEVVEQVASAITTFFSSNGLLEDSPSAMEKLAGIGCPTVVLLGDRDYAPVIACNEFVAQSIPGCELVRLPGVDHMVPQRAPRAVIDAIRRVLRRSAPEPAA